MVCGGCTYCFFCVTSSCYVVAPVRILYCGFADNADFYKTICIAICESAYHKDEYRQCYRTDWACIAQIDNAQASGYVTINGIEWAARSADGSVMEVDTMVTVKSIEGVKVIVERKNSEN